MWLGLKLYLQAKWGFFLLTAVNFVLHIFLEYSIKNQDESKPIDIRQRAVSVSIMFFTHKSHMDWVKSHMVLAQWRSTWHNAKSHISSIEVKNDIWQWDAFTCIMFISWEGESHMNEVKSSIEKPLEIWQRATWCSEIAQLKIHMT